MIEVLTAAMAVYSLCNRILTWIDQLAEKEIPPSDISSDVLQIQTILYQEI